jgi:hypothetical protein
MALEGVQTGANVVTQRRSPDNKKKEKGKNRRGWQPKARRSKVTDPLTALSDDELTMEAPESDASCGEEITEDASDASNDEYDEDDWLFKMHPQSNSEFLLRDTNFEEDSDDHDIVPEIGMHWEFDGTITQEPNMKMPMKATTVKPGLETHFKCPIDAYMAVLPLELWEVVVQEVNRYAEQQLAEKKQKRRLISGLKWMQVTVNDIMTYFGILIYSMLYPQTGISMHDSWDSPYFSPWTKFMSRRRFQQISSVLHFNDNNDVNGMRTDGLHKIRPVLNILKKTLGQYAELGSEHSFDEGTMACRSKYGRHLITFNASKPTGKFHFKLYLLCCAGTNLVHKLKVHSRDKSDLETNDEEMVSKIDSLTLQMCAGLYNSGSTINMDNYYMSTTCAIRLKQKGVFCRGTIRSSRKFLPKSILFSKSEIRKSPRGMHRTAVNHEHGLQAIGWLDNKAVHMISTADTTDTDKVSR